MSHKGEAYSSSGAFFLDNPIRRWLEQPKELTKLLALAPTDVVIDFGCGPGFFTIDLAKNVQTVIAIDISSQMLQKVQKKAAKHHINNIRFLQSDGASLQLNNASVDLVLLVTVYHEVGETETVLSQFSRVLKPSGRLVVVEVIKKGVFPGPPVQVPEVLQTEIEANNFKLQQMVSYKNYGIFFFNKTT